MGAPDRGNARLRHAEVLDLPGSYELLDSAGHVFDRHIRVDAVLIEQVDPVGAQAPERVLGVGLDVLRADVHSVGRYATLKTEFGGDHHLIAKRLERLADQLFIGIRAIGLSGIEESDAAVKRCTNERNARMIFYGSAKAETYSHAAKPERRDLQSTFS
jgi:Fe2+ transport system protein B